MSPLDRCRQLWNVIHTSKQIGDDENQTELFERNGRRGDMPALVESQTVTLDWDEPHDV